MHYEIINCNVHSFRDLADINGDGGLTRDGFAVALYLIQKKLAGTDIPTSLPPSLIPPSMRTKYYVVVLSSNAEGAGPRERSLFVG